MKNLIFLFLTLMAFSCNNLPDKGTNDNNNKTANQIETPKADIVNNTDSVTTDYNQDFTYKPANNKTIQRADDFMGFAGLYKQFDKPPQTYTIESNEDKTITCKEGTIITLKANSFVTEKGNPVKGGIKIQVKEYFKVSDILLANLTTTSNNDILETGGMIYVDAFFNGEKCDLKVGATIGIAFPTKNKKNDMQLYSGVWDSDKINWILEETRTVKIEENAIFAYVEIKPEFPGGEQKIKEFLSTQVNYPVSEIESGIQGMVHVGLIVDENGEIGGIRIVQGVNPSLDKAAISAVEKMPKWTPGKHAGENVKVHVYIPISFSLAVRPSNYSRGEKITIDSIKYWIDGETAERLEYAKDFEEKMNDKNIADAEMSKISQYIFNSPKLGWINCDRFYKDNSPKIDFFVNIGSSKQVDIKIVFNNINSILTGSVRGSKYTFDNVPTGHSVTLVALKYENDQYYLAVKKTKITRDGGPTLDFEPVTMARLKTEMEKLNRI